MRGRGRVLIASGVISVVLLALLLANAAAVGGPVASWALNEGAGTTAADDVGVLDGTLDDGASWISDGVSGAALHFDDGRVSVPDDALLRSPAIAVRLWVRGDPEDPPANGEVILEKGGFGCTGGAYALVVDRGHVALRYRETASPAGMRTLSIGDLSEARLPTLWDGAWHLVAFSSLDDQWGWVSLYQQGWSFGTSPAQHTLNHTGLDVTDLSIGGPAQTTCETPGFTGDIDDIAVYPRFLTRDELAAAEPTVTTSLSIRSVGALEVDKDASAVVEISPRPIAPGTLSAFLVDGNGVEHGIGLVRYEAAWQLPTDGRVTVPLHPELGGNLTLKFKWVPALPQLASSTSTSVTVARAATQSWLTLTESDLFMEHESIDLAVGISSIARVTIGGTVELWEQTAGGPVLIDTQNAVRHAGGWPSFAEFSVPARAPGTYEFFARYLGDASFEPSEAAAESLTVRPALVPGIIKINGGAEVTNSEFATLDLPAVGAVAVQLSYNPDNVDYLQSPRSWAATISFRLTDSYHNDVGDGVRTIWARLVDAGGNWSGWMSDSIILDRGLPTISDVSGWVEQGVRRDATVPVLIDWAGADTGVGVADYDVAVSKDGKAWSTTATNTASPGVVRNLAVGHSYRFRVRGTDRVGNRSGWTLSPTINLTLVQDGSRKISYLGRWTKATGSIYWGGSARYASATSAAASIAFTGKGIAWVSPVGPTRGEAYVYVDGALEATINLWAPAKGGTRVVFERSWATSSAHSLRVVVAGTPGHSRIDLDGFLIGS